MWNWIKVEECVAPVRKGLVCAATYLKRREITVHEHTLYSKIWRESVTGM